MRKKFNQVLKIAMMVMLLAFTNVLYAQRDITGIVKDAKDGNALPGVNVMVKGTSVGSTTNVDGKYSVRVPSGSNVLVFSFIGYDTKEITLIDAQDNYDVMLDASSQELEELVVTALGIRRESKSLGYSTQEVRGEKMVEARDNNIVNTLSGKVSGLTVTRAGTGQGGSSRMIIRGNNSISGNNMPLLVVDGIPVNNFVGGSNDRWGNRAVDLGSGISDINPDDVESVSVLKGAAASALYGSMAGNGVIMITTKKGSAKKGLGISFNTNTTFESVMSYLDFQNKYGQGDNSTFLVNGTSSWGPEMAGQSVTDYTGNTRPFVVSSNDLLKDFLRTGITTTNSLEIQTGNESVSFIGSISNMYENGILPNNNMHKTSVNARTVAKLGKKIVADFKVNYIRTSANNRPKLASDPDNVFLNYVGMPRSVSFKDLKLDNGLGSDGLGHNYVPIRWDKSYNPTTGTYEYKNGGSALNPYISMYQNTNEDTRNRIIGMASLQYNLTSFLDIKLRYGLDYYNTRTNMIQATGMPYWSNSGDVFVNNNYDQQSNADAILSFNETFSDFSINAIAGFSIFNLYGTELKTAANGLVIPGFYSLSNGVSPRPTYKQTEKEKQALFASATFGYKGWLFLDATARNDWSSTLPSNNRSYFYPSVGLGWVVSDMLKDNMPGWLSFAKVRLSYAEVGNDTDPFKLQNTLELMSEVIGGIPGAVTKDELANSNLKPENTKSMEIGSDIRFFSNRLGVDFTLYKSKTYNQIIKLSVPGATGYAYKWINAGAVQNKGIELSLKGTPVKASDFTWDIIVNYAKNKNEVIKLGEGITSYTLSDGSSPIAIKADVNKSYGEMYGTVFRRNSSGQVLCGANGLPLYDNAMRLGNYLPNWTGGIMNSFLYKNFSLSFLIDMRQGGEIWSGSIKSGLSAGTLTETGGDRETSFVLNSRDGYSFVQEDGTPNTKEITKQQYYQAVSSIDEFLIHSATFCKLRELTIGYTLPKNILQKTPIASAKISLVGHNLLLIYSDMKGLDPESTYSTGNALGVEYGSMPATRSIGFNINLSF